MFYTPNRSDLSRSESLFGVECICSESRACRPSDHACDEVSHSWRTRLRSSFYDASHSRRRRPWLPFHAGRIWSKFKEPSFSYMPLKLWCRIWSGKQSKGSASGAHMHWKDKSIFTCCPSCMCIYVSFECTCLMHVRIRCAICSPHVSCVHLVCCASTVYVMKAMHVWHARLICHVCTSHINSTLLCRVRKILLCVGIWALKQERKIVYFCVEAFVWILVTAGVPETMCVLDLLATCIWYLMCLSAGECPQKPFKRTEHVSVQKILWNSCSLWKLMDSLHPLKFVSVTSSCEMIEFCLHIFCNHSSLKAEFLWGFHHVLCSYLAGKKIHKLAGCTLWSEKCRYFWESFLVPSKFWSRFGSNLLYAGTQSRQV